MIYAAFGRVVYIIKHSDTKPTELFSSTLVLAWGLLLLAAPSPSLVGQAFIVLSQLASEDVWGIVATVIGVLSIYGLLFDGHVFRFWMLFCKTIFWMVVSAGTLLGNSMAPAWLFYFMLSISSGWAFVRLRDKTSDWAK